MNCRRNILPLAVFGISSMKRTPPYSRFCSDTRLATKSFTSCSDSCSPYSFTTNASGSSPARSSGTPITAASLIFGCSSSIASSSAGGTWKPLYLISSLMRSTMKNSLSSSYGAAPQNSVISEDRSYSSTIGCLARNTISGGTSVIRFTPYFWMQLRNRCGSKRGITTHRQLFVTMLSKPTPATTWNSGVTANATS
uniref:Uncharacterized protein n=1 Tax=Anopheles farauti TaxID=69004 RepID=A0A182Q7J1_9DIPT